MRIVLLLAVFVAGLSTLSGCSDDKTTPAASSPPPTSTGEPVSTAKGAGRIPAAPK